MNRPSPSRSLFVVALAFAWVASCGRTGLDEPGGVVGAGGGSSGSAGAGGTGARGGTGGGLTGGAGRGGTGGSAGSTAIPCGNTTCAVGTQSCCLQPTSGGMASSTCIGAQQMCAGGVSLACVDTPSCGRGRVCCLGLGNFSTSCAAPAACLVQPGLILCTSDSDCNALAPRCCLLMGAGVCATAQACNGGAGTGAGGAGGRGGGRGGG